MMKHFEEIAADLEDAKTAFMNMECQMMMRNCVALLVA